MAKALKTLKFPGIAETYTVPVVDNTLSIEGAAADAKAVADAIQVIQGGGAIGNLPDMTGILPATKGGTGLNSVPANNFIVGSGSTEMIVKTAEQTRTLIGAAKESEVLALSGGTMTGAINMGGKALLNLPTPTAGNHAATKEYVDAQVAHGGESKAILYDGTWSSNTPINFNMVEGDSVHIIFDVNAYGSNADIFMKANGTLPSRSRYWFSGNVSTSYEGGLVARTGQSLIGTLEGTLTLYNGLLRFTGQDNRGADNATGVVTALWYNVNSLSNITFYVANQTNTNGSGHIRINKISNGLTNLNNAVFYGSTQPPAQIGAIWLKPIE